MADKKKFKRSVSDSDFDAVEESMLFKIVFSYLLTERRNCQRI